MFNTIIEIKRENKKGQLNIKINLYHNNEEELNKIVKAINKFKFYNETTITNNDNSLSYTKATNVMTINNISEELLNFDNNIKELENLFVKIGAEPLILEGYLKATDKKEYKEEVKEEEKIEHMEKAGNNQNIEENTKNNNNVLKNLEIEIKELKKDIEVKSNNIDIFNDNLKEEALFETQIELDKKEKLYKKVKNFEITLIDINDNSNINMIMLKDKKNIEYTVLHYKSNKSLHVQYKIDNVIYNIFKLPNDEYILDVIKNNKHRNYSKVGKEKREIYEILLELYKLLEDTK